MNLNKVLILFFFFIISITSCSKETEQFKYTKTIKEIKVNENKNIKEKTIKNKNNENKNDSSKVEKNKNIHYINNTDYILYNEYYYENQTTGKYDKNNFTSYCKGILNSNKCNYSIYLNIKKNLKINKKTDIDKFLDKGYKIESIIFPKNIHYSEGLTKTEIYNMSYSNFVGIDNYDIPYSNFTDKNLFSLYKKNLFVPKDKLLKFIKLNKYIFVLSPNMIDSEKYKFNCWRGGEVYFYCNKISYINEKTLKNFNIKIVEGKEIDISSNLDFLKILFIKEYVDYNIKNGKYDEDYNKNNDKNKEYIFGKNIKIILYKNDLVYNKGNLYSYKIKRLK